MRNINIPFLMEKNECLKIREGSLCEPLVHEDLMMVARTKEKIWVLRITRKSRKKDRNRYIEVEKYPCVLSFH